MHAAVSLAARYRSPLSLSIRLFKFHVIQLFLTRKLHGRPAVNQLLIVRHAICEVKKGLWIINLIQKIQPYLTNVRQTIKHIGEQPFAKKISRKKIRLENSHCMEFTGFSWTMLVTIWPSTDSPLSTAFCWPGNRSADDQWLAGRPSQQSRIVPHAISVSE